MKKIAIFVSGEGKSAQRIIKLFNEGNRLKTVLLVMDDSSEGLRELIHDPEVMLLHVPDNEWHLKGEEIGELLREKEVDLLVLDNFSMSLADEILEATNGEVLRVNSAETAPREVVAALEADLHNQTEEKPEGQEPPEEITPSAETEWAEALKIQYKPPKVPLTPPELPEDGDGEKVGSSENFDGKTNTNPWNRRFNNNFGFNKNGERRHDHRDTEEPMPSTWLIWSVLVTVFCCFIPGIVAIIFSSQVSSRYYAGDIEGARRASKTAEIWIIVSFVLGVLAATLYLPFIFIF